MHSSIPAVTIETRTSWVVAIVALLTLAFSFGAPWVAVVSLKAIAADFGSGRETPALAGSLQKKVSNGLCFPLADILSQSAEQICGAAGVLAERRFLHAAMGSEPLAELVHKGWVWWQSLN